MQNAIVVCLVRMMVVPLPVGGMNVNLDIPGPECAIDSQHGIKKIGAAAGIMLTRFNHFDLLTVVCEKIIHFEETVLPDIMQECFSHFADFRTK